MVPFLRSFRSLRTRLAVFFAALIATVLLAFGSAVYVAAVVMEAHETESQTEKEHELRQVRHLLYVSLSLGIPLGAVFSALGSYWMTRRTLRAMSDIVETASALAPDGLNQRIPLHPEDDVEIRRLVGSLNHMLARVERAVSGLRRFTQDAAHEMRTPIAALRTRLEIALRKSRDEITLVTLIEETLEELDAQQQLVEALLLLARSDAGELQVKRQPVVLHELIADVVSLYEAIAEEQSQQVILTCPQDLVLCTDKLLLCRVLANLVDNACKYTPRGGHIVIEGYRQSTDICICVSDSGPGILPKDAERIFERFFRGDSHRGSFSGFGLGLSIARELVSALGGRMSHKASASGGTVFQIIIQDGEEAGGLPVGLQANLPNGQSIQCGAQRM